MSAIAYVTDSKMLELHRLNRHKTMNFWRLSTNISFSAFHEDDLVFFLSKDKEHRRKDEKGIVGFGRLKKMSVASIKTMWERYGIYNRYQSLEDFKQAILKVAKDRKLPKKISGFYLENVTFFQPVYLSECGIDLSNKVESYIYLKDSDVVMKLLALAKHSGDLWTGTSEDQEAISEEEKRYVLFKIHEEIKDIEQDEKTRKRANKALKKYMEEHPNFRPLYDSGNELYHFNNDLIEIVFYHDRYSEMKTLAGQAFLYRKRFRDYFTDRYALLFHCSDEDRAVEDYLN